MTGKVLLAREIEYNLHLLGLIRNKTLDGISYWNPEFIEAVDGQIIKLNSVYKINEAQDDTRQP